MSKRIVAAAFIVLACGTTLVGSGEPALAGDVCLKPVSAEGPVVTGWKPAMAAARDAWQRKVRRQHGGRFADWWYSGDRSIECTWDASGTRYRCRAAAIPCGRA